jgi:hypothetical protein
VKKQNFTTEELIDHMLEKNASNSRSVTPISLTNAALKKNSVGINE